MGQLLPTRKLGRPTDLPWGLEIDAAHRPLDYVDQATFHPTFLYESLWCLAAAAVLVVWRDHHASSTATAGWCGALYVMLYTVARGWIECCASTTSSSPTSRGCGSTCWTSLVLFVLAAAYFVWSARNRPGRETDLYRRDDAAIEPSEA